jgi:biotin carboxyl carrier protein
MNTTPPTGDIQDASPVQAAEVPAAPKPRHPVIELLARYRAIFRAAWAHRAELAGPARMADEAAFLPAALSLQDTPVHPAPRRFAYAIMALFVIAVVWSIFGKIDIVAIAPGRVVVSERTKLIQPLERSVVKSVLVKDGDRVREGQALVELDRRAPTKPRRKTSSSQPCPRCCVPAPSSRRYKICSTLRLPALGWRANMFPTFRRSGLRLKKPPPRRSWKVSGVT